LGERLVDRYLEFVAGRCRPNTLRAVAFDLKAFFAVTGKDPVEVTAADVFEFLAQQRGDRTVVRRADRESGLADSQALATRTTRWLLATQARLGMTGEARALLAALDDERASSGEIRNARAVICLAEGDPAAALAAVADVLDGTAPVLGYVTVIEAHLLAGFAHRQLGDQRAANQAAERALALAESDRLVLPFAMTGSAGLLEALPRHQTAHGALLADILDVLHGSSPAAKEQSSSPPVEELSPGELKVLRYLPTNLSRPEIAGELSVSLNTVSTHLRSIYAKLQVRDRSSAVRRARELRLLAAGRTR
jgi:LuxR family maltose regulon positive regulatory protein